MTLRRYNLLLPFMLAATLFAAGCGSDLYEGHSGSTYTAVTSVQGVVFDMPTAFLSQSTAVTSITPDKDYTDSTYLYKDGKGSYLLFNIGSLVVSVENNTKYDLENAENKQEAVESKSLGGIWFTPDGKKMNFESSDKKGAYKAMTTAIADVSITKEAYGEFVGKYANLETDGHECTLFIGAKGTSYKDLTSDQKDIIEHVAKSFTLTEDAASVVTTEAPATEVATEAEVTTEIAETTESTEVAETEAEEPATEETTEISETEQSTEILTVEVTEAETETTEAESETEASTEAKATEETETKTEPTEETETAVEETEIAEETETETETESATEEESTEDTQEYVVKKSNQGETGNGYSDIYHQLKIGESGRLSAHDKNSETGVSSELITIEQLYTGQDAIDIIKNYCASGKSLYNYFDAPEGYSWHVVKYSLEKAPADLYVNIKVEGLDGERLTFRGVSCTTRTYDIFYDTDATSDIYCYYAVPNGCEEYMLECGDRQTDTSDTACYYVGGYR